MDYANQIRPVDDPHDTDKRQQKSNGGGVKNLP